jgi:hypothetical protein
MTIFAPIEDRQAEARNVIPISSHLMDEPRAAVVPVSSSD